MATSKYPTIPQPRGDIPSLLASIAALTQAVNLLIVNSQPATSQGLTQGSQVFAPTVSVDESVATLSGTLQSTTETATQAAATANAAQVSANTANAGVDALNPQVSDLNSIVGENFGLKGTILGSVFSVIGVTALSGPDYTMDLPGSVITDGTIGAAKLGANAATMDASTISAGAAAACSLTLPVASDVIVIASYLGTGIATPAGTGELIVNVDGSDFNICPLSSSGGNVIPATGFRRIAALGAGAHTFTARAEFSTGPTDLNGVSIVAMALMR